MSTITVKDGTTIYYYVFTRMATEFRCPITRRHRDGNRQRDNKATNGSAP